MTSQSGGPKHRHKTLTDSGYRLSSWVEVLIEGMYQSDIQSDPGPNYWIRYWDEIRNVTRPIKCQKSASQNLQHRMVSHMLLCLRPVGMSAVWSYFRKKRASPQSLTYAMQMFHDGSSVGNFNTTNIIKHLQKH